MSPTFIWINTLHHILKSSLCVHDHITVRIFNIMITVLNLHNNRAHKY